MLDSIKKEILTDGISANFNRKDRLSQLSQDSIYQLRSEISAARQERVPLSSRLSGPGLATGSSLAPVWLLSGLATGSWYWVLVLGLGWVLGQAWVLGPGTGSGLGTGTWYTHPGTPPPGTHHVHPGYPPTLAPTMLTADVMAALPHCTAEHGIVSTRLMSLK